MGKARRLVAVIGTLALAGIWVGVAPPAQADTTGYRILDVMGEVSHFGSAPDHGSLARLREQGVVQHNEPAVDIAANIINPDLGYTILDRAGGIYAFGGDQYFGSLPELRGSNPGMATADAVALDMMPFGNGYAILDSAGGVFTFGEAPFFGSIPGLRAAGVPVPPGLRFVEMRFTFECCEPPPFVFRVTGYILIDELGGVWTFGSTPFEGSVPGLGLNTMASAGLGVFSEGGEAGYAVIDREGGVFTFGFFPFAGSIPGLRAAGTEVGPSPFVDALESAEGYYLLNEAGGVFTFAVEGGEPPPYLGGLPAGSPPAVAMVEADFEFDF